jgi:hypothetical protein
MSIVPVGPLIQGDSNFSNVLVNRNLKVDGNIDNGTSSSTNLTVTNLDATNLTATNLNATSLTVANETSTNTTIENLFVSSVVNSVAFTNTNNAYNYNAGALRVSGGIGVTMDIYSNGTINANYGYGTSEDVAGARQGITTLVGGCSTVGSLSLSNPSRIFLTIQNPNSGTVGSLYIKRINYSNEFIVQSTSPNDASTVAYEIFSASGFICFHRSCFVQVLDKFGFTSIKQLDKLTYGSKVLVMDPLSNNLKYSPIVDFTGFFLNRNGSSINITYSDYANTLQTISLSDIHLIYASKQDNKMKHYKASDLKIGDTICINDGSGHIKQTSIINITNDFKVGWISPLTKEGTIVVNNAIFSCHTDNHNIARIMYWPLQKFLQWFPYKDNLVPVEWEHWYSIKFKRGPIGRFIKYVLSFLSSNFYVLFLFMFIK